MSEPLRFRTPKEAETQASKSKGNVDKILLPALYPTEAMRGYEQTWLSDKISTDSV